jgi:lipoprotein-anchoring transpeptidase ErfK/SrfK
LDTSIISKIALLALTLLLTSLSNGDKAYSEIVSQFDIEETVTNFIVIISIEDQKLYLIKNGELIISFDVSTSKYGIGFENGSLKTPLGLHSISKKIGSKVPINGVLKYRNYSGNISIPNDPNYLNKDIITTRILWLSGEESENKLSYKRCIYIHGTPEENRIGAPASHGCIRMRNTDVFMLYEAVDVGTLVIIKK